MSSPLLFAVIASFHGPALRSGAVHGPVFHGSLTLAKKNTVAEEKLYASGNVFGVQDAAAPIEYNRVDMQSLKTARVYQM